MKFAEVGTATCQPVWGCRIEADSFTSLLDPGPVVTIEALGERRIIDWGQKWQMGTAAYWVATADFALTNGYPESTRRHQLGSTLREEVAACVLGGFGMPFELGLAAFRAIRDKGILAETRQTHVDEIEEVLREPLLVGGAARNYRFPSQRASRLARCLAFLDAGTSPADPLQLRDWLLGAPGIGPKTASWIVRNHLDCDDVAILDVHVMRAGITAGVFDRNWDVTRNYLLAEAFFLEWARLGGVRASHLDATIWSERAAVSRLRHYRRKE
ncbi:MAG: 8-oxoguanine DNA glycosylase [Acidimicrobiales bacterium]